MIDAVVVGAGPAGLAAARELRARGLECLVLEAGEALGWSWRRYYDSLVLHTGRHLSALPGLSFEREVPMFVPRAAFVAYLDRYARTFELPVRTSARVDRLHRGRDGWVAAWPDAEVVARTAIVATGIASGPVRPRIEGLDWFPGRVLHSVEYRRPADVEGRVLVVGAGNSGAEIAAELGRAGVDTTIAIRSGVTVVPRDILGIPSQYLGLVIRRLPRPLASFVVEITARARARRRGPSPLPEGGPSPLDAVPLIGFNLPDAVNAGAVRVRPGVVRFEAAEAVFADGARSTFDVVLLATGFRPALGCLEGTVRLDDHGFAARTDRVTSADAAGLFFVGHNYDASGGLYNIRRDARLAAERVASLLGRRG